MQAVRSGFWTKNLRTPVLNTWRGLAFEDLCLIHQNAPKAG